MSDLQRDLYKKFAKLPPMPPMPSIGSSEDENAEVPFHGNSLFEKPLGSSRKKDYSPISWETYFDSMQDVILPENGDSFRVYYTRSSDSHAPLFVLHHGAGHSGLSFGIVAGNIRRIMGSKCSILSFDCRGHGYTTVSNGDDLTLATLSQDLTNVVKAIYGDELGDIVLVGHSMGGSVVAEVASKNMLPRILGVVIIDVVEGSAMDALVSMKSYLATRPQEFRSIESAVEWSVRSRTIRNIESAKLSIPSLLRENSQGKFVWKVDLEKTEKHWTEWFTGLSEKFLSARAAKLLILAGTDRLDKPLTIAQMQGRFQLQVFNESGHAVQEDEPERMAIQLSEFLKRNERLVLPKKVQ